MQCYSSSRITHQNRRVARRVEPYHNAQIFHEPTHERYTRSQLGNCPRQTVSTFIFPNGMPRSLLALVDRNPSGPRDVAPAVVTRLPDPVHLIDLTQDDGESGNETEDDGVDGDSTYGCQRQQELAALESRPSLQVLSRWPCVEANCENDIDQDHSFFHCTAHFRYFSQLYPRPSNANSNALAEAVVHAVNTGNALAESVVHATHAAVDDNPPSNGWCVHVAKVPGCRSCLTNNNIGASQNITQPRQE